LFLPFVSPFLVILPNTKSSLGKTEEKKPALFRLAFG